MTRLPEYAERAPATCLARHVACVWRGRLGDDGTPFVDRVLPDGCIDLVWDGRSLFVAGPDTGPVPIAPLPRGTFAGIRFRPGSAPAFLGVPASALRDQRVRAADVLGSCAAPLVDRLAAAASPRDAGRVLERAALGWLSHADGEGRLVAVAVSWLAESPEAHPVSRLAERLGVGERHLYRRCLEAVGYGPKTLHRVLRFRRWLDLVERSPDAGLAWSAARAGYADQAHLTRDVRQLAGSPPAGLLSAWRPAA